MKSMNPESARTLTFLSAALAICGGMVMSPSGALFFLFTAAIAALLPAAFGRKAIRIIAVLLLLVSACLAFMKVPDFRQDQEAYRNHTERNE